MKRYLKIIIPLTVLIIINFLYKQNKVLINLLLTESTLNKGLFSEKLINDTNIINKKQELLNRLYNNLQKRNSNAVYNFELFNKYVNIINKYINRKDINILEIGPGGNLSLGYIFTLNGYKKYYGLDIYQDPEFYNPISFKLIESIYQNIAPEKMVIRPDKILLYENNKVVFNKEKIEYLFPYHSYNIPLESNSVDFIFSHSGFEHFLEPEKTIDSIYNALKKGSYTAHNIDLRDHSNFSKPFEFLKMSKEEWRVRFNNSNIHFYENRWRMKDYIDAFKKRGFTIISTSINSQVEVTEEMKKQFHSDFQKYTLDELSVTGMLIVAKKQ